jgi:hypothetical protein
VGEGGNGCEEDGPALIIGVVLMGVRTAGGRLDEGVATVEISAVGVVTDDNG